MDDNFGNRAENNHNEEKNTFQENTGQAKATETDIKNFTMDNHGNIRNANSGAAVIRGASRTYLVLGWIGAAMTALIHPFFAIPGILFGVLANRQTRGIGNAVIITNAVLALLGIAFGLFLTAAVRRMIIGY